MGLFFYYLIVILYYIHVEGSTISDHSSPDRRDGIVYGIAKLVYDVYKTLLWLTQTTKNVAYPMTTVMATNGLHHQLVTPTPRGQNDTWRKIIVWEVVFPEAINEFKVDADDGMILCMKVVNEQIFRGQALGKSMMSVLKIICAKYGIAVNIMAQNSETNTFSFVKKYALAHIFRTKYYENRSKEYSSRITDRVISNLWTYGHLHDGLHLGDWQRIINIQQNTLDLYHNRWCETYRKTFAIDWHDYTLNNINVSSKYDVTLGLPRTHWIPEYTHTPDEEKYIFSLHTMRHQTYCVNFRSPNVDLIHSRNNLVNTFEYGLDHQYIGLKSFFGYFATSLLTLYTMFSDIFNFKTNCNNDTDENNCKHICVCNTTKTIYMGYHGACLNACKQKVFNFSCSGSEYWQENQTWHPFEPFDWWMFILIFIFALVLQCLFHVVMLCPADAYASTSTTIGGKRKGMIKVQPNTHTPEYGTLILATNRRNMHCENTPMTIMCTRCTKRKILFRQVIRPKHRRIEGTDFQGPKSKTLRLFTRNKDKHINTSFRGENQTTEKCMHVKKTYLMKTMQQESQTIYNKHSDKILTSLNCEINTRLNSCTRTRMRFRTAHEYPSCEKTFLQDCDNTYIKRDTATILLGDRPDEEQTTLKSIAEEMHPCSDDYENAQEVTYPMDLGISSRQNSDINENTDELDFSILMNRDESIPSPDVEGTHDPLHEILTDEMQFSSSSKHSLLHSDISKTFSSSVTSFDGKMSLDKDMENTACGDILTYSDLSNIEVYGCTFSTRRDVTTVKNFGSPIESLSFETHNNKREITNEKFKEKKSHQNLYSLIKEKVEKYFDLRLRRKIRRNKSKVKRRIRRFCLRWKKPKKVNHESIQCCPFLNVGNTEDCNQPQTTVSSHPIDEEYLHSHTPPESVGSLSSLFNDISFQSAHDDDRYRYEWFRLASLCHFDSDSVHAIILARNGWYGRENGNETVCYSCHRVRDSWESGDDPRTFHDSNCRFLSDEFNNVPIPRNCDQNRIHVDHSRPITGRDTLQSDGQRYRLPHNNVTTDERQESSNMSSQLSSISSNSSSIYRMQYGRQDISERPIDNSQRATRTENGTPSDRGNQTDLGSRATQAAAPSNDTAHSPLEALMRDPMGINFERPKYPSYAILAIRISSYTDWPTTMTQTPRDMSLAGFFYAGYGDYTRCFFCGGGLRNWEAGDDPWVEHARWFSKCAFVRQNRGQQFIDLVLQRMREIEQQQTEPQVAGPVDDQPSKEDRIMNSAAVRSIKDMGYNDETIKAAISAIKSRLPKGKHKVSAHEILEVVFELIDKDRTGPSTEMNWSRHAERATTTEDQFHNTNITEESKDGPQQSEVEEEQEETASQRFNSLTLNDVESLQRENTSLKDQILCKICMEKNVSIAFLPCGHLACCVDCAPAMRKCPICREFVRGTVKTFLV